MRRASALAAIGAAAVAVAACQQLLGIQAIDDDAPDAAKGPADGSARDGMLADVSTSETGSSSTDGGNLARDATPSGDAPASSDDAGPIENAAYGCASPDGAPVTFFSGLADPKGLVAGPNGLYFVDGALVRRCSLEGCDAGTTIITDGGELGLAATTKNIAYCTPKGDVIIAAADGTPVKSYLGAGCFSLAGSGDNLYWTAGSPEQIVRGVDGDAGSDDAGAPIPLPKPGAFVAPTSKSIFISDTVGLARCDLPACASWTTLAYTTNYSPPLAVNEESFVWYESLTGVITMCPAAGCGAAGEVTISGGIVELLSLYADERAVYWTSGARTPPYPGQMSLYQLDGGTAHGPGLFQDWPGYVTANAACIYWSAEDPDGGNSIWAVSQP